MLANLRLVLSIAWRYVHRTSMRLEDLVHEGVIGFIHALEKFDVDRGYRLSTYATWWIRQAIGRAVLNSSALIRVPVHIQDKIAASRARG